MNDIQERKLETAETKTTCWGLGLNEGSMVKQGLGTVVVSLKKGRCDMDPEGIYRGEPPVEVLWDYVRYSHAVKGLGVNPPYSNSSSVWS